MEYKGKNLPFLVSHLVLLLRAYDFLLVGWSFRFSCFCWFIHEPPGTLFLFFFAVFLFYFSGCMVLFFIHFKIKFYFYMLSYLGFFFSVSDFVLFFFLAHIIMLICFLHLMGCDSQLGNTEEYIDGQFTGNLGEILIRYIEGSFWFLSSYAIEICVCWH